MLIHNSYRTNILYLCAGKKWRRARAGRGGYCFMLKWMFNLSSDLCVFIELKNRFSVKVRKEYKFIDWKCGNVGEYKPTWKVGKKLKRMEVGGDVVTETETLTIHTYIHTQTHSCTRQFTFRITLLPSEKVESKNSLFPCGKIAGQTGLFNLGVVTVLEEVKVYIQTS